MIHPLINQKIVAKRCIYSDTATNCCVIITADMHGACKLGQPENF